MLEFLLISGCTSPKESPTATPTKDSRPLLRVTFKDGTCFYDGPTKLTTTKVNLKLIIEEGNEDAMSGVAVVAVTLNEGKTIEDLRAWPSTDPPTWLSIISMYELFPGPLEKDFSLRLPSESVYFVCFHPDMKISLSNPFSRVNPK